MSRIILALALALAACTTAVNALDRFAGGDGSKASPWLVASLEQLQAIDRHLDGHFALAEDLDASTTTTWNDQAGFTPIGDQERPFLGSFDGRGHGITGLVIRRFGIVTHHIGLFGCIGQGAEVRRLRLLKAVVKGCDHTGVLAGWNLGVVTDCHASGDVWGSGTYGGLIGYVGKTGRVSICQSAVNVHREWVGNHLGGLAGGNCGLIENCYANGMVQGNENPGGLVGVNRGIIRCCYATGDVIAECPGGDPYGAGGLVAVNLEQGTVERCFAVGKVTGAKKLACGGVVGNNREAGAVTGCWFAGGVSGVGASSSRTTAEATPAAAGAAHFHEVLSCAFQRNYQVPARSPCDTWDFQRVWSYQRVGTYPFPVFKDQTLLAAANPSDDYDGTLVAPLVATPMKPVPAGTIDRGNDF